MQYYLVLIRYGYQGVQFYLVLYPLQLSGHTFASSAPPAMVTALYFLVLYLLRLSGHAVLSSALPCLYC